jgi:hypothetical protein
VSHCDIDGARETGLLVEGAAARVENTLVLDTAADPCAHDFGDGIGVYGRPFAPASLELDTSRIEGSTRADLAAFGGSTVDGDPSIGSIKVTGSLLLGAAEPLLLDTTAPEPRLANDACGTDGSEPCANRRATPQSAFLGGAGCMEDETTCHWYCSEDDAIQAPTPVQQRAWIPDHDEVAPAVADADGCTAVEGIPRNSAVNLVAYVPVPVASRPFDLTENSYSGAYLPGMVTLTTGTADPANPIAYPNGTSYPVERYLEITTPFPEFRYDFRTAPSIGVWICGPHPELLGKGAQACKDSGTGDRAIAGVNVALDDQQASGPGVALGPGYSTGAAAPSFDTQGTRNSPADGAVAVFWNVPAGEHVVTLTPADPSKTLHCAFDVTHGPVIGEKAAGDPENVYRVVALPGIPLGLYAFCSPE